MTKILNLSNKIKSDFTFIGKFGVFWQISVNTENNSSNKIKRKTYNIKYQNENNT